MIRWKTLGRRFDLPALVGLVILVSCSGRKTYEQSFLLEISERKKFLIGESGLTPEPLFFVSLDSSRGKGVIFNKNVHSLDSIYLSADSAWVREGAFLENDGPFGIGTVFSFFATPSHVVYMNPQEFFSQDRVTKEVSRKFMHEYGIFGKMKYPAIAVPTSAVGHEFNGLDRASGVGYFVFENGRQISVMGYDTRLDSMFFLPVGLDSVTYFKSRFRVKSENLTLGTNDEPRLSVVGDLLIVSYPSFSDILVYDLKSGTQQVHTSTSNSFPPRRIRPENYSDEVDSFERLFDLEDAWEEQVCFGVVGYLENLGKYIRLVKGEGGKEASYFLEIFDQDFQKRDEFDLTKMNPDLSGHYLNTKYGLMFRAQDQPEEDVMYYYDINLLKGNN
jgi:hypothetical protein